jgi:hypothetical protein
MCQLPVNHSPWQRRSAAYAPPTPPAPPEIQESLSLNPDWIYPSRRCSSNRRSTPAPAIFCSLQPSDLSLEIDLELRILLRVGRQVLLQESSAWYSAMSACLMLHVSLALSSTFHALNRFSYSKSIVAKSESLDSKVGTSLKQLRACGCGRPTCESCSRSFGRWSAAALQSSCRLQ